MDQVDEPVREIAGEVRAEIERTILTQAARDKDFGVAVGESELDAFERRVGDIAAGWLDAPFEKGAGNSERMGLLASRRWKERIPAGVA